MTSADAVARVRFEPDWRETLEGDLRPGGRLVVEYLAARRRQIFDARLAGGIVVHARFAPGGQSRSETLGPDPVVLVVPADAVEVAIWFRATEHGGAEAWDSRFGENFRFPVDRS